MTYYWKSSKTAKDKTLWFWILVCSVWECHQIQLIANKFIAFFLPCPSYLLLCLATLLCILGEGMELMEGGPANSVAQMNWMQRQCPIMCLKKTWYSKIVCQSKIQPNKLFALDNFHCFPNLCILGVLWISNCKMGPMEDWQTLLVVLHCKGAYNT